MNEAIIIILAHAHVIQREGEQKGERKMSL